MDGSRKRRRKLAQDVSSKRMREISDEDAPRDLHIVQVNREAFSGLARPKSVQTPDMSHREPTTHDPNRDARNGANVQQQVNASTPPPPPPTTQRTEQPQRRSSGFRPINASQDAPLTTSEPGPATARDQHHPPLAPPVQPLDGPLQQAPNPRRSSAVHQSPLQIVPVEVSIVEGQQSSMTSREQPHSSEVSEQSYTTAQTNPSRRSSTQAQNAANHVREQLAVHRNADLPQNSASLQTAQPHHTSVQPLTLQPTAAFRDPNHGHHAFRVSRSFIPQQQHQQGGPQPQPQQLQLQHPFVAHAPVQHGAQRHLPTQQQNHQHQNVLPRQLLPASNFSAHQQALPVRRPSPHQILHSHVRRNGFAEVCTSISTRSCLVLTYE